MIQRLQLGRLLPGTFGRLLSAEKAAKPTAIVGTGWRLARKLHQIIPQHRRLLFSHQEPEQIRVVPLGSFSGTHALKPEQYAIIRLMVCPADQRAVAFHRIVPPVGGHFATHAEKLQSSRLPNDRFPLLEGQNRTVKNRP